MSWWPLSSSAYGGAAWHFAGPPAVVAAHPVRGPAVQAVYGPGVVEAEVMLPIGPKVIRGRLAALKVDEGERVREGQVLAELDSREQAASVAEWEARVTYAEAQFRRADELYRNGTGTQAALDQARNEAATARAALDRARRQLADMVLTAPADGTIIRRDGEIGQLLRPGDTLFWMACCAGLRISAEIDEEDISQVRPGLKVLIRADAFANRVFEGTVADVTPKGDPVARSFRVRVRLPADSPLMIGMTADCNIIIEERKDALLVPATAVVDGKVWVVQDGVLAERAVTVGVGGERLVEVRTGLSDGDFVVQQPVSGLRPGRAARIVRPGGSRP
ncbi:MAG: efflux RND transporter periplasmic adaptor subunit [Alphaproteobacteria bacterium]|nr:efflux RND transporter periplasmic adaptor subunit [Alphaproteobacteria bacterium]